MERLRLLMRITGLEPARGTPLDPKSSASANSAISAYQQMYFITSAVLCQKNIAISIIIELTIFLLNERAGIRTPDNLIKSQVLYHLSYTPSYYSIVPACTQANWASWIRTSECRSQSPVPYRLAIAQ